MRTSVFAFVILASYTALPGEADYFTNRYPVLKQELISPRKPINIFMSIGSGWKKKVQENSPSNFTEIEDSLARMNEFMNTFLTDVANKSKTCEPRHFEEMIQIRLGGLLNGSIEGHATDTAGPMGSYNVNHPQNAYGTIYSNTLIFGCCTNIMKINGSYVATDKLSHFISHGYEYFEISQRKNTDFETYLKSKMRRLSIKTSVNFIGEQGAYEFGVRQEKGAYGLKSTGTFSYSDLAANHSGYLFWKNLYEGKNPYFHCKKGLWKKRRNFDWSEYITDAWDEGVNCNEYKNDWLTAHIQDRVKEIQQASNKLITTCPVEPSKCSPELLRKYRGVEKYNLNPTCVSLAKSRQEDSDIQLEETQQ